MNMNVKQGEYSTLTKCSTHNISATSWENGLLLYMSNKGAKQPVHLQSLTSVLLIRAFNTLFLIYEGHLESS